MLRAILVDDEDLSVRMLESIVDWRRYGVEITATARRDVYKRQTLSGCSYQFDTSLLYFRRCVEMHSDTM